MSDWRRVGGGTICERSHYIDDPDDMVLGCSFCANADNIADTRWRPMRTAPKDGTVVEVRLTEMHTNLVLWGVYEGDECWVAVASSMTSPSDFTGFAWRPTHPEWDKKETNE